MKFIINLLASVFILTSFYSCSSTTKYNPCLTKANKQLGDTVYKNPNQKNGRTPASSNVPTCTN